ncbi:MAG TPA: type 1 glutamine amidotransferase, partial [Candidatus Binatia bacterium]|nr:type 1 glutamine amidotransferase [Candidatus Binatia bacterium]
RRRGCRLTATRLQRGERLPGVRAFDWLIVMGGPMNIYQQDRYPWLVREKDLINDACVTNKKVLGLCLGGQLLADVLGGPVTSNQSSEIGWFGVEMTAEACRSRVFAGLPRAFPAFHWHADTFAIPPRARHVMRSAACANQGFEADDGRLVGLQCHLEVRHSDVGRWVAEDPPAPGPWVQTPQEMSRSPARFAATHRLLHTLLERMAD